MTQQEAKQHLRAYFEGKYGVESLEEDELWIIYNTVEELLFSDQPTFDGPVALLNTTIATTDGDYTVITISLEEAKKILEGKTTDSAIGHKATADIMSTLLDQEVPMDRKLFVQQPGQQAIVFKLNGRIEEGEVLSHEDIEKVGYTLKLMVRTA